MNYFKVGDPVVTVINGELVHAKVVSFYPQISTAIVVTEDQKHIKVSSDSISPEPEAPKKEGVTITAEEFTHVSAEISAEIIAKIIADECRDYGVDGKFLLILTGVIVGKIRAKLFGEADND